MAMALRRTARMDKGIKDQEEWSTGSSHQVAIRSMRLNRLSPSSTEGMSMVFLAPSKPGLG